MAVEIQTPFGSALPPAPRHAITVHMPAWQSIVRFTERDPELFKQLKSMYPRFVIHRDIEELAQKILGFVGQQALQQSCYIFPSHQAAKDCVEYATSSARADGTIPHDKISLRVFKTHVVLFVVVFPVEYTATVHNFWLNAGVGISSRLAEDSLKHIDSLEKIKPDVEIPIPAESPAHVAVKDRIASLLNRAPVDPSRTAKVSPDDIFLFTTGMSSIYWVHRYLLSKFDSPSVLFGFSFHSTIHVLEDYGPGVEFFGLGDEGDLTNLEHHLSAQKRQGTTVQAIWAEFPSNPLLNVPDLLRLRHLADSHGSLLIVDDTIGSFCSIDVLGIADIIVSSLTKSFSGYADLMGGSAVLSPLSAHYTTLQTLFAQTHHTDFYAGDADQLAHNSEDYLSRSAILNRNAESLVSFLHTKVRDPASSVKHVFYPTTNPSLQNYTPFLRASTPEFPKPGYGCLFSVEFRDMPSTIAFYDALHVHKGPHLGAHLTIALGYSLGVYGNEAEWAAGFNLRPNQVRVSVGLEDQEALLETFKCAVDATDHESAQLKTPGVDEGVEGPRL